MTSDNSLVELATEITSAYVAANKVEVGGLPDLIRSIYESLASAGDPSPTVETTGPTSAQIKKSITPEALISFEDGKPYKALKRHLSTRGMSIADYKAKWGLPQNYPTVAAAYAAKRSALAKSLGLGRKSETKSAKSIAKFAMEKVTAKPKLSVGKPNPKQKK